MAETREDTHKVFDFFIEIYESKYPKATECLQKDKEDFTFTGQSYFFIIFTPGFKT